MELQKLIDGLKAHKNGAASYESVDEAIRVFEAMLDVDGEKVVKGLDCCIASNGSCCPKECPYQATCFAGRITQDIYVHLFEDALSLIRQQQERIAELEAGQKWISVKDRLPRSMANKVLVYVQHEDLVGYIGLGHYEKFHGEEMWYDLERGEQFAKNGYIVTHRMPLPEPPKEEEHATD